MEAFLIKIKQNEIEIPISVSACRAKQHYGWQLRPMCTSPTYA